MRILTKDETNSIPKLPQTQRSREDQLFDLAYVAERLGFYDAATYLKGKIAEDRPDPKFVCGKPHRYGCDLRSGDKINMWWVGMSSPVAMTVSSQGLLVPDAIQTANFPSEEVKRAVTQLQKVAADWHYEIRP